MPAAPDLPQGTAPTVRIPLPPKTPPGPSGLTKAIYGFLIIVPIFLVAAGLLIKAGVLTGRTASARTPWDLAVLIVAVTGAIGMGIFSVRRLHELRLRARADASDSRRSWWELVTLSITAPLAALLAGVACLVWAGLIPSVALTQDPITPLVMASIALLIASAPAAAFDFARERHERAIEARFPDLLRDLNESQASGMTMAQAIRVAARGDYGRLDPEIQRMAHQISWGVSFSEALEMFSTRVGTRLVTRAVALINKATRAGGDVKDVLAAAARDARELEAMAADRRSGMALYVIVIYISFGVFLGVVAALQGMLVPSLLGSGVPGGSIGSVSVGGNLEFDDFRFIYFGIGLVQALGSGIVAGVMSEGSLRAGLKHTSFLVAFTVLALGIML